MNEEVIKILTKSLPLVEQLRLSQSGAPDEREMANQQLANWLHYLPEFRDEHGNLMLPPNVNISQLVAREIGIIYGKGLYRNFPDFASDTIDSLMNVDSALAYKLSAPLLSELGKYVGLNEIRDTSLENTLKSIEEGKLSKDEAKKIAREYAEKYIRTALENDSGIEREDIDERVEVYADVWAEGVETPIGRAIMKKFYGEIHIAPWMEENKDKLKNYAESIKEKVINSGKASSFEGYTKVKDYMHTVLSTMEELNRQSNQQNAQYARQH